MSDPDITLRVLDALPHALSVMDGSGRLAYANPAFWREVGVAADVCPPGSALRDVVRLLAYRGHYGRGDPEEQVAAVLAMDRSRPLRRQVTHADGSRSFEVIAAPLPGGGFLSVAHEITALLRAREEQAARARLLETTLTRLSGGVARYDSTMRLVLSNPAYEMLLGLPGGSIRAGMTARDIVGLMHERGDFTSVDEAEAVIRKMERDRERPATRQHQRVSGEVLRFDSQPMHDGGFVLEGTDITGVKRAEGEARRRAAVLDGLLEALPHGVCVYGADRRVQLFNAAYARLMDGTPVAVGELLDDIVARRLASGEYDADAAAMVLGRFVPGTTAFPPVRRARPNGLVLENYMMRLPDGGNVSVFSDVTALHRAEAAARERAALLDVVLETLPEGVCVYGPDRRARIANAAYHRILGDAAVRLGESLEELGDRRVASGEMSREVRDDLLRRHAAEGPDAARPIRRLRPDGTAIVTRTARLPDGGFVSVISDVTPLHRAQEELRRRAALLEASFAAMRHGIAVFGPDRRLLATNTRTAMLTGLPIDMLAPGTSFDELVDAQLALGIINAEQAAFAKSIDRATPHSYLRSRGGAHVEVLSDPTADGGFVITFNDVSALHRAESELRHRAAMQEAMLGTIRHGIILYGPDRRVLATNAKTSELTGMPPDQLLPGKLMDELIEDQVQRGQILPHQAAEMREFDRRRPLRYSRNRPDGRVLDTVSEPTPDGGYVITYSDVTEERAIRAELERARAQAESASEAKSRFLATMSHELRTPLNAVIGLSEAIGLERDADRVDEYASMINEAGRQLLQLVDDILDVARSQTGTMRTTEATTCVADVLSDTANAFAAAAAARGLELVLNLPPDLPALRADPVRLRQVLDKLFSNALKFTPAGGFIRIGAAHHADHLAIHVADTGIGIPPADRERMFEPFTQLDSSLARRFQGSGLGLHLARSLTHALGGTLSLEDPEGPGIVAVLRFPADRLLIATATAGALPA